MLRNFSKPRSITQNRALAVLILVSYSFRTTTAATFHVNAPIHLNDLRYSKARTAKKRESLNKMEQ